jgi:hypothetical protein
MVRAAGAATHAGEASARAIASLAERLLQAV